MPRERRQFQMDQQLLVDIIKRQAGSLWKAISEAVMNAVDAGATTCEVELTRQMLTIKDNGRGFRSRKEIENYFEVFGKQHAAEEQKTFGRFRMGRGQLFAFGFNTWRSNKFEMTVDIDKDGLDYHFRADQPNQDGCTITVELYQQLSHTDHARIIEALRENCKYVEIAFICNGKSVPTDRSRIRWDIELPEADIRLVNGSDLKVYNQGVLVRSYYRHVYGTGGDVVTKVPIKVNFARNDIMDDCPVWRKLVLAITKRINEQQTGRRAQQTQTTRRRSPGRPAARMTEDDRVRLANQVKDKQVTGTQFKNSRLFKLYGSRANCTIRTVFNRCDGRVTVAPVSTWNKPGRSHYQLLDLAKKMAEYGMAATLDHSVLDRWGVSSGDELVAFANAALKTYDAYRLSFIDWNALCKSLESDCQVADDEKLNKQELVVISILRECVRYLLAHRPNSVRNPKRKLVLGAAPFDAWTDGHTLIGIGRDTVGRYGTHYTAWIYYGQLIMREFISTKPTVDKDHERSPTLYKTFYNWSMTPALSKFAKQCMTLLPRVADNIGQRLREEQLRALDIVLETQLSTQLQREAAEAESEESANAEEATT